MMSDLTAGTASATATYQPFPSFVMWVQSSAETTAFDRYTDLFLKAKQAASPEALTKAIETANRYAAVDTNAIEGIYESDRGFTRTVATQAASWESVMDSRGPAARRAFEDALNGYEYVLDAVTRSAAISQAWIRELHEILCATQDEYTVYTIYGPERRPLPKGTYKTLPNSPTLPSGHLHAYAPVLDTPAEMQRFVDELRTVEFNGAHPVLQASYAHYAYVCIHPFADGNGRVARALASIFTYRAPGVPLVIFADQRNEYFDALAKADDGDPLSFIQFVGTRTIDTVGIIRQILENSSVSVSQALANLHSAFRVDDYTEELQAAVARLRDLAVGEAQRQLGALGLPTALKITVVPNLAAGTMPAAPPGYGSVGTEGILVLLVQSHYPVTVNMLYSAAVFRRTTEEGTSDFLLLSIANKRLEIWMREIVPSQSEAARMKVAGWVEGFIADLLTDIATQATGRIQ